MLSCAEGNVCAVHMASHGRLFGKDEEDPWVSLGFLSEACLCCDAVPHLPSHPQVKEELWLWEAKRKGGSWAANHNSPEASAT